MAEQNPNARPDEQTPEQDALEKSLEELSLDELLASVKDDLARVDAMMDGPGDAAQPEQPDAPAPDTPDAAEEASKPGMQPLFEPKIPEEYADLTVDQETQPESQEPEKKRPRLPSGIRVLLYVCCVLAVAVLLAVAVWRCADDVLSLTKEDAEVTVSIPDGATISQIAGELKSKGLVRYETLFKFYCWASHAEKTIEPGTYTLNSRYDYHALVSNMIEASPDRAVVEVTIPEGYECEDIFRLLEADGVCSYQDLADTAASYEFAYDFLQEIPYGSENRLEGYLFPDTYQFYMSDDPANVIDKFLRNFDNKFTDDLYDALDALNDRLAQRTASPRPRSRTADSRSTTSSPSPPSWRRRPRRPPRAPPSPPSSTTACAASSIPASRSTRPSSTRSPSARKCSPTRTRVSSAPITPTRTPVCPQARSPTPV